MGLLVVLAQYQFIYAHQLREKVPYEWQLKGNRASAMTKNGSASGPSDAFLLSHCLCVCVWQCACMYTARYSIKYASSYLLLWVRLHLRTMWAHGMRFCQAVCLGLKASMGDTFHHLHRGASDGKKISHNELNMLALRVSKYFSMHAFPFTFSECWCRCSER